MAGRDIWNVGDGSTDSGVDEEDSESWTVGGGLGGAW